MTLPKHLTMVLEEETEGGEGGLVLRLYRIVADVCFVPRLTGGYHRGWDVSWYTQYEQEQIWLGLRAKFKALQKGQGFP